MKAYKKKGIAAVLAVAVFAAPVSAYAASFNISSGLQLDTVEATFDDSRIIYGEAAPHTEVTFTVSAPDRPGGMKEIYTETITVGSMGLFSVTLPLQSGSNHITLTAEENGEAVVEEVVIRRVSKAVKDQLQNMIALPGLHTTLR